MYPEQKKIGMEENLIYIALRRYDVDDTDT